MIGRLVSRKRILIEFIISIPGLYLLYAIFSNTFKKFNFYLQNPEFYSPTIIFIMISIIIAIIIVTAGYGNRQIIVIDKKYFKYCSNQNLWSNYQQFYRIIFNREQTFDIQIPLDNIAKIALSYSDIYMLWNQKGHSIILNLELIDGTLISINPDNLYFEKENFLQGIKFIEAQGVKISDPYHLKEALANKDMRFAEYIEKDKER